MLFFFLVWCVKYIDLKTQIYIFKTLEENIEMNSFCTHHIFAHALRKDNRSILLTVLQTLFNCTSNLLRAIFHHFPLWQQPTKLRQQSDFSDCVWTLSSRTFSTTLRVPTGRAEWDWYLGRGWCCFVLAWWLPGCWGSVRGPERCRRDAERQPTGAAALGGRAKWLSYPGDCEHTTSLNTIRLSHAAWCRGSERPALPVVPDVRLTSASGAERASGRACVREAADSHDAGRRAMCS